MLAIFHAVVLIIVLGLSIAIFAIRIATSRQVLFHSIAQCPKKHNLPVIFQKFVVEQVGKNEYVASGKFELKSDFPDGWRSILIVK